jgi:hypothetical protein
MNIGCDRFDDRIFLNCMKDSDYFNYHADSCCFIQTDSLDTNEINENVNEI